MAGHLVTHRYTAAAPVVLVLVLLLAACGHGQAGKGAQRLSVQLGFLPSVENYAIVHAANTGAYRKAGLHVDFRSGASGVNPVQAVATGAADIGVALPDEVILASTRGQNLKVIAVQYQISPNAVICRKDSGINHIRDIKGKTIGLKDRSRTIFSAILSANGLTESDVRIVPNGNQDLSPLLVGSIACVVTGSAVNWPNVMKERGIEPLVFYTKDIGLPAQYNAYVVQESTLKTHRDALLQWVRTTRSEWQQFLRNPNSAADWIVDSGALQGGDRQAQRLQAQGQANLMTTGPAGASHLLSPDVAVWQRESDVLFAQGVIDRRIEARSLIDLSVVRDAGT
jgi:ABC-type nitrate/sulfonate/bicarbonate transport system substrate-binding protein